MFGPQHLLAQHLINQAAAAAHPASLLAQHPDPAAAAALFYHHRLPYDFGAQYAHNLLAPHLMDFQTQNSPGDGLAAGGLIQLTSR